MLPTKRLLIQRGKAAWALYIDVVCINYDGNPFDAIVLAVMAALKHGKHVLVSQWSLLTISAATVTLPEANFDDDAGETVCSRSSVVSLEYSLRKLPLACSFAIFEELVPGCNRDAVEPF